ncbi:MAG: thioredoxin domain-containing protein [Natronohydrobacter sp.]|nr:thioredoxin domain-containing protein [Natronohydrobacter sp.]
MAGSSDTTTKGGSLQLSDSGLIGTCFAAAALGLLVLTSPGSGGNATTAPAAETGAESDAALAESAPAVSEDDREFGDRVRSYLLQNPEVIFEAVAVYEQRNVAAQADMDRAILEANAEALFNDGHSWVGGNPEGDVTLVEFIDYRCGFCKRAHDEVATLLEADGNIRLIVKEFPILGPDSELASRFAVATLRLAGDETYEEIHDLLMRHDGAITPEYLDELAASFDLDFEAIVAEMESEAVSTVLAENRALAQRLQISGTPTFVMETEMIRGFVDADVLIETAQALRN